jgi:SpoIID/LytB domain protein
MRSHRLRTALTSFAVTVPAALGGLAMATSAAHAAVPTRDAVITDYATSITVKGHGFGHGDGMSQWGAYGYAVDHAWTWTQILDHYYGGTTRATIDAASEMTVRLIALDNSVMTAVVNAKGLLGTNASADPNSRYKTLVAIETASGAYVVYGRNDVPTCPASTTPADYDAPTSGWTKVNPAIVSLATAGHLDFTVPGVDPATPDPTNLIGVCQPDGSVRIYRGSVRPINGTQSEDRTVNVVPLDLYVRGVVPREVPASWASAGGGKGAEAVRAQAVAARTYSMAEHRYSYAKTCDTQSCQVYGGVAVQADPLAAPTTIEDSRSNAAVADTAGVVLHNSAGGLAYAQFASSSGGWTSGANFPVVEDLGDATATNPNHSWTTTVAVSTIEAAFPTVGSLQSVDVTKRNGIGEWGGRALTVNVRGTAGLVTVSGEAFRSALGLKSTWFTIPTGCSVDPSGAPTPPSSGTSYHALTPVRLVDTRLNLGSSGGPLIANCVLPVTIAGAGGVPPSGATAVTLSIVAVGASAPGYLAAYPCADGRPLASNVNYGVGQVVSNLVTVPIDRDGLVCIYTLAKTDVVVDVLGWYGESGGERFSPRAPARLVDTRDGTGGHLGRMAAAGVQQIDVPPAAGGMPSSVVLNVTGVNPANDGYLTVYSCDVGLPGTSNVNLLRGRVVATQVVSAVSSTGKVCVYSSALTDVVVDVLGSFGRSGTGTATALAGFAPLVPSRLVDTRPGGPVAGGSVVRVPTAGHGGVPANATAVVVNVAAADAGGPGYLTVFPCGTAPPLASNVNFGAGGNVANLATVQLGGGDVCVFTSTRTGIVVDAAGWYG